MPRSSSQKFSNDREEINRINPSHIPIVIEIFYKTNPSLLRDRTIMRMERIVDQIYKQY